MPSTPISAPSTTSRRARSGPRDADAALGRAIRELRTARGLTLVEVAAASDLSHPFLSQLERGRARPSMRSLYRIAQALGTTQQALLAAATPDATSGTVHADDVPLVDVERGGARLVFHEADGADVTEFVGSPAEFGEFFSHDRTELVYVVRGHIELELREAGDTEGRRSMLGPRDSIAYPGETEHRFRQVGEETAVVIVVHSGAGTHRSRAIRSDAMEEDDG